MNGHRSLVLASARRFCVVCGDLGRVRVVSVGRCRSVGSTVPCPHCSPSPGETPIPIYLYPLYKDRPEGAA